MENKSNKPIYGSNSKVMLENGLYGLLGASERYILELAEGNPITLHNIRDGTLKSELTEFRIFGWSMQTVTTGAQLFDKTKAEDNKYQQFNVSANQMGIVSANNYWITGFIELKPSTQYASNYNLTGVFYDENKKPILSQIVYSVKTFRTPVNCKYAVFTFEKELFPYNLRHSLMVCEGTVVVPHEEYSNGVASPSEQCPQPITCAGSNGGLNITIGDSEHKTNYLLCGIQVSDGHVNYTYQDEYGQKWVADELDIVSGKIIRRLEASETKGISILPKQSEEVIAVSNLHELELYAGNVTIQNDSMAYMKIVYKATGS